MGICVSIKAHVCVSITPCPAPTEIPRKLSAAAISYYSSRLGGCKGGWGLKWAPPLSLPYGLFCWGFSRAVAREIRHAALMHECNSHVEKHQADRGEGYKVLQPTKSCLPLCEDQKLWEVTGATCWCWERHFSVCPLFMPTQTTTAQCPTIPPGWDPIHLLRWL